MLLLTWPWTNWWHFWEATRSRSFGTFLAFGSCFQRGRVQDRLQVYIYMCWGWRLSCWDRDRTRGQLDCRGKPLLPGGLGKKHYFYLKENQIFLVYSWNIHSIDMSLILTVLDKLSYFLSLIAFCISVSYSWLKWKKLHLAMHKEWKEFQWIFSKGFTIYRICMKMNFQKTFGQLKTM